MIMSMSSDKDKAIDKAKSEAKRHKKKSGRPTDNTGERYVTGMEGLRTQGKGMRIRDISGWHSPSITEKLNKIFNKRQKEYRDNTSITPIPEFDDGEEKETK